MKVTAKVIQEFDVVSLNVRAEVRYWEDATVNGIEDSEGTLIPFRSETLWSPTIDLETGCVLGWPKGTAADIHYKVCDAGEYELIDADGKTVALKSGYVPDMLGVSEPSYGDYIIMKIGPDGLIVDWKPPVIDPELWSWELAP